jgi:F-type H+-transporting ATPase subunit delta
VIVDPVTQRYAEAFFELASEKGVVDEVRADVERIAAEVADETVGAWLFDARVPVEERRRQVDRLLVDAQPLTRNFVGLLFDKGRVQVLRGLGEAFRRRWLASRGAVEGVVESALALGSGELAELAVAVGATLGKEVLLANRINSDLVGGVRVLVENRLIDYSVRGRLAGLRRKMMEAELPTPG